MAGLLIGGHYGEGALRIEGRSLGYFQTSALSYGLQAGGQTYGYAIFFMTDDALSYLEDSGGWEIGMGPSIVVVDQGMAKTMTTTTQFQEVYAIIFDQQGLMAGLGLQGSKISQFIPR
jgi:lipid-binding SYLF domain-containing protein